ncbi:DNA-(apurinic or apyrimidinic site) lyase /endonuclease III [Ruminococcus sp. YE71]|uniref:endonuclease III n=1 Tax=unclassified Ruminococcus TaxID=2608920 RepID=UPI00088DD1D4|nr:MULTISPECIES: endonuclease III [unclassified Ruminococcus]SDA12280.1 DNA-(apurinic or apyrimidinic site) lyase /endonuclease III [Ruminococcus sp. YE78]SFW16679.1 DNA-(apurinic or apyrimidinic site) lyase /endonuclease III [Ruminococcus sp. YE71]
MRESKAKKRGRAEQVIALLEQKYPDALCSLTYQKPHELMIAGRLSAQCTDARVNIVTKELFAKYTSIEDFAAADVEDVAEIIKPCGLYKTKAQSVVGMCRKLMEDFGGEIPDTLEELTTLPGIGRKTANLILGDVFGKPAVVADTHCIRICGRLGFTTTKDPVKTETELRELLPPEKSSDFCHRLVLFGRETCKARGQRCGQCELKDLCPSFNKTT